MERERITWIDHVKIVAGLLMLLDHTLLYLGQQDSWMRCSITRAVEPLYVFCFGYLVAGRARPLSSRRMSELVFAAMAETALHSLREGHLYLGILASLTVVAPFAPWLARMPSTFLTFLAIAASGLSLTPASIGTAQVVGFAHIDYGPALLVSQVSLAILVRRNAQRGAWAILCTWFCCVVLAGQFASAFQEVDPSMWTLLVGHPLAFASVFAFMNHHQRKAPFVLRWIATRPLTFYLGHLAILGGMDLS